MCKISRAVRIATIALSVLASPRFGQHDPGVREGPQGLATQFPASPLISLTCSMKADFVDGARSHLR
jgi:hypothetical protein